MKAEGILMHRERNVIAVRAPQGETATVVQVSTACNTQFCLIGSKLFWRADFNLNSVFLIGPRSRSLCQARDMHSQREVRLLAVDLERQASPCRLDLRLPPRHHAGSSGSARQSL